MGNRKQAVKFAGAVILLGMLIFFGRTKAGNFFRSGINQVLKPFFGVSTGFNQLIGRGRLSFDESLKLVDENNRLKERTFEFEKLKAENESLKKAFSFKEEFWTGIVGARVLFNFKEFGKEFLLIDQGRSGGIKEGDLVIDSNRLLVGIVKEAGEKWTKVEVASNSGRVFEIEFVPAAIRAVAKGLGNRAFSIEFVPVDAQIPTGSFIALTNSGFVSGPILGEVVGEKVLAGAAFKEIRVVLLSRPDLLREVFIIKSHETKAVR